MAGADFVVSTRGSDYWLDAKVSADDQRVELANILRAIRTGRRYVQIGPRRFAKIADTLKKDLDALAPVLHLEKDGVRAGAEAIALIEQVLGTRVEGDTSYAEMREKLRASRTFEPAIPDLRAELRDYQIDIVGKRAGRDVCLHLFRREGDGRERRAELVGGRGSETVEGAQLFVAGEGELGGGEGVGELAGFVGNAVGVGGDEDDAAHDRDPHAHDVDAIEADAALRIPR